MLLFTRARRNGTVQYTVFEAIVSLLSAVNALTAPLRLAAGSVHSLVHSCFRRRRLACRRRAWQALLLTTTVFHLCFLPATASRAGDEHGRPSC